MGLQGITINTAPEAEPHIYAEDDAAIYESIVGTDGVFSIGQKLKATTLSNNQVRIADGVICIGGHFARIPYGDYVDVSIANGQSGRKRNDIIIGKIVSTGIRGIDTMTCEVKQGTAATTASDPALTQNNLYAGGMIREIPLYRVKIEGLSIVAVEQLFKVIPTIPQIQEQVAELNSNMKDLLIVKTYSQPITVPANSEKSADIDVTLEGYTPLGIVGYTTSGSGSSNASVKSVRLNDVRAIANIKNNYSSECTWTFTFYVLYKRTV